MVCSGLLLYVCCTMFTSCYRFYICHIAVFIGLRRCLYVVKCVFLHAGFTYVIHIYNKISMPWLGRTGTRFPRRPHCRCRFIDIWLFQVRSYCSFTAMSSFLLQFYGYTITLAAVLQISDALLQTNFDE